MRLDSHCELKSAGSRVLFKYSTPVVTSMWNQEA